MLADKCKERLKKVHRLTREMICIIEKKIREGQHNVT